MQPHVALRRMRLRRRMGWGEAWLSWNLLVVALGQPVVAVQCMRLGLSYIISSGLCRRKECACACIHEQKHVN